MQLTEKQIRFSGRIIAVAYLLCVMILCFGHFNPNPETPVMLWNIPLDKIAHFLMFLPLPVIALFAIHKSNGKAGRFFLFIFAIYLFGSAFAAGIEIVQSHIPYRSYDLMDFVADTLGLMTGCFFVVAYRAATGKW